MSFHSLEYALFLPLAVAGFFFTPHRFRWIWLLLASMAFYASWRVEFLSLLLFSTGVDYTVARALPGTQQTWKRRGLMAISLMSNLGLLIAFKFFTQTANLWFDAAFRPPGDTLTPMLFLLPLGISFYTFQTLGYTIDVFKGKREPERHLGHFAVYVMFFPQLIAGPIERAGRLMPQLQARQHWDWPRAAAALGLILLGLFKKLVIADGLAQWLGPATAGAEQASSIQAATISMATIYRYYADLSGYTDIAIGSALLFGIQLSQNFRRPFAARTVANFWQRWHITVTNWFRDYLYVPLMRRLGHSTAARVMGTLIVMVIVGIWHGGTANWIMIGAISGLVVSLSYFLRKVLAQQSFYTETVRKTADWTERLFLYVFLVLMGTLIAMPDPAGSWVLVERIVGVPGEILEMRRADLPAIPIYILISIGLLEIFQWFDEREPVHQRLVRRGFGVALAFYLLLAGAIITLGSFGFPDFLYFEF